MKKPKLSSTYVHKENGLNEIVQMPYGPYLLKLYGIVNPHHPQLHENSDIYFFSCKEPKNYK